MSELPKNTREDATDPPADGDEPDGYGSTSIDRSLLARLKEADAQKAANAEKDAAEEPLERTSPGVELNALGPPPDGEPVVPEASEPTPISTPPDPETKQETVAEPSAPSLDAAGLEPAGLDAAETKKPEMVAEIKEDSDDLDQWGKSAVMQADAPAEQESGPHTDVRKDVVGINEAQDAHPPPGTAQTKREGSGGDLKATIDLPERDRQAVLDDGWGSRTGTGSNTKSALRRIEEPETGAMEQVKAKQATALIAEKKAEQDAQANEDPDAPRLICIQGPDLGKEFVLSGRDIAIGRAPGNDVIINDPSVSRTHCRLLIDQGRYVATDQRSGNGTFVNGRKIERADLSSGSTIKVGQTMLRFVEMGDVIKSTETESVKAEEEQRSRIVKDAALENDDAPPSARISLRRADGSKRYALIIVAAAVLVGLIIVVWSLATRSGHGGDGSPAEAAEEAYDAAALALKAKELDRAEEKLRMALAVRPNEARYKELLALVQHERGNLTAVDEAKRQAQSGRFADALIALGSATKDTLFKAEVVAAREEVRELVLAAVRKAIDGKDAQTMAALARDVGEAYQNEPDVKRLIEKTSKARPPEKTDKPDKQPERAPDKPPEKTAERAPERTPDRTPERPSEKKGGGSLTKATEAFNAGRAEDALEQLGQIGGDEATALKNKIAKFIDVYKDAKAQAKGNGGEAAVKKALAFESKIAQGKSVYAGELRALQAEALVESGGRALDQKKYLEAYKAYRDALALQPDAAIPKRKITEIQAVARDLYNQGYINKDSDRVEARAKWERVLLMLPPEDELYQKAKKWLDSTK
jgi:pSer/pThr/pTyr-binding forkhead associated (FHA) protein